MHNTADWQALPHGSKHRSLSGRCVNGLPGTQRSRADTLRCSSFLHHSSSTQDPYFSLPFPVIRRLLCWLRIIPSNAFAVFSFVTYRDISLEKNFLHGPAIVFCDFDFGFISRNPHGVFVHGECRSADSDSRSHLFSRFFPRRASKALAIFSAFILSPLFQLSRFVTTTQV